MQGLALAVGYVQVFYLQHEVAHIFGLSRVVFGVLAQAVWFAANQQVLCPTLTTVGCLAQRNKGGARRAGDIRGARYPVGVSEP